MTESFVTAAVLGGGKSRRMGRNKALLMLDGEPLIKRVFRLMKQVSADLVLVTNTPDGFRALDLGARIVGDIGGPGRGPLAGLAAALLEAKHDLVVVTALDMPFLNPAVLLHLAELADGYDAVVPITEEGYYEPLHSVYRTSCLPAILRHLDAGERKVISFYHDVALLEVPVTGLRHIDPELRTFVNANTPHEWAHIATNRTIG